MKKQYITPAFEPLAYDEDLMLVTTIEDKGEAGEEEGGDAKQSAFTDWSDAGSSNADIEWD